MASPTSVIRRYTPPTCTLEISAKDSVLSRWMGQSVLKNLRFKLSFDDPRLNETEWIMVTGNRAQLQALSDAVTSYVQKFLSQSRETLSQPSGQATAIGAEPTTNFVIPETNPAGIYLQPKGILSHELHLGSLATEQSGPTIRLSAVQLADLASALDEYAADVTALPNLERSRWGGTTPAWGAIAAAAVVTLGLAGFLAKVLEPSNPQTTTTASQGASSNDQRLAVQPLPNNASPGPLAPFPSGPLPPLGAASPNPSATAKTPNPAPGAAPNQIPKLTISQQPPVDAPPPQITNLPVREVPVSAIPNQASGAVPSSSAASKPATGTAARSNPTAVKTAPNSNTAASESAPEVAIAPAPQADRSASQASAPASLSAGNQRSSASTPQVAEVKNFFESRWQPPKELTEAIEYRLVVAPDGTLQTVTPLGKTADLFLDRTPMPFTDQKFVSPVKGGSPSTIRLVLSPDGKVQTFLEAP